MTNHSHFTNPFVHYNFKATLTTNYDDCHYWHMKPSTWAENVSVWYLSPAPCTSTSM